jgi:hypothetical protein
VGYLLFDTFWYAVNVVIPQMILERDFVGAYGNFLFVAANSSKGKKPKFEDFVHPIAKLALNQENTPEIPLDSDLLYDIAMSEKIPRRSTAEGREVREFFGRATLAKAREVYGRLQENR